MKWAAPRAGVCVWVRRSKWPPGKNSSTLTGAVFVLAAQALDVPQENALGYGARESGAMFYNYFRSYSPSTGRYTQPDPMGLAGGWNGFGYADANPLSFVDPDGLQGCRPVPMGIECETGPSPWFDPENPYAGRPLAPSPNISTPSFPEYTLPGMIQRGCQAIATSASDFIMQMAKGKKKPPAEDSDEELGGHRTGKRPSTKDKHEKGDERRLRDKGGEKKDGRMKY